MRRINNIVLHHTACESNVQVIRNYHIRVRQWRDIFYHYVIDRNGLLHIGRSLNQHSNRNRLQSIEIAIIGRLHIRNILPAQEKSLINLLDYLYTKYGSIPIRGHNFFDRTVCPGNLDVKKYADYMKTLNEEEKVTIPVKNFYRVISGSFLNKLGAEKHRNVLRNAGFVDTIIRREIVNDFTFFRVQIGAFLDKENAERVNKRLNAHGFQSFIILQ